MTWLIGVGLFLVVALVVVMVVWGRARPSGSSGITAPDTAAVPASPASSHTPDTIVPPSAANAAAAERARRQIEEMARAYPPLPDVQPSGPERRRGESDDDYTMRRRAVSDYQRFLSMGTVSPEHDQAIRRLIVDAQDNWQLALKTTGRKQPDPTVNIMMDPVLGPILQTLEADFRRDATPILGDSEAAMLQSMVPTLLPYVRTGAFQRH